MMLCAVKVLLFIFWFANTCIFCLKFVHLTPQGDNINGYHLLFCAYAQLIILIYTCVTILIYTCLIILIYTCLIILNYKYLTILIYTCFIILIYTYLKYLFIHA